MTRKKYRLRWAEAALQDLESIIDYLAAHGEPTRAFDVHDGIVSRVESLAAHPNGGHVVPELREVGISDYRELIEGPYRIRFRIYNSDIVLVAVFDARRDLTRLLIDRAMGR